MTSSRFSPTSPYTAILYLRMSDDMQNPLSPETQDKEIRDTLARCGYPWVILKTYRDDAKSGRRLRMRKGFVQMIQDIETGVIKVDLILVDMLERFSRGEELGEIRRRLQNRHGVLVLTADSRFADPTTVGGMALTIIETIRSTGSGTEKAHTVRRGKKYAATQGHWPGGPPPLGYRLESVMKHGAVPQEVDYRRLVLDPVTAPLVREIFRLAHEHGWSGMRLAQHFNDQPEMVAKFGPFRAATLHRLIVNPIYKGMFVWGRVTSAIVDDMRVLRPNEPSEMLVIAEFCEPLVDGAIFDAIVAERQRRGAARKAALERSNGKGGKLLAPMCRGLVLKYPLTGLVRCACCGGSMRPVSSGVASGAKRYVYYSCPNNTEGTCPNDVYVPEGWLWERTVAQLRHHLLPAPLQQNSAGTVIAKATSNEGTPAETLPADPVKLPDWVEPMLLEVQTELDRLHKGERATVPTLQMEQRELESKVSGWTQSLGNPTLPLEVRRGIEGECTQSYTRLSQIEAELQAIGAEASLRRQLVDPVQMLKCLQQLADVLRGENATAINLELSRHIDRIEVHPDKRVLLWTCRLGAFEGLTRRLDQPLEVVVEPTDTATVPSSSAGNACSDDAGLSAPNTLPDAAKSMHQVTIRTRVQHACLYPLIGPAGGRASAVTSNLPSLSHLPDKWFWIDEFRLPSPSFWSKDHALAVAAMKAANPKWTQVKLSAHFGVSLPTIRKALRLAAETSKVKAVGAQADSALASDATSTEAVNGGATTSGEATGSANTAVHPVPEQAPVEAPDDVPSDARDAA